MMSFCALFATVVGSAEKLPEMLISNSEVCTHRGLLCFAESPQLRGNLVHSLPTWQSAHCATSMLKGQPTHQSYRPINPRAPNITTKRAFHKMR
jgi:hypothetical protein